MNLKELKYFANLYKQVRKAEGHVVRPLAALNGKQNRNTHVKTIDIGILSSLFLASRFIQETQLSSRMDPEFSSNLGLLSPPENVRGMKCLDKTLFDRRVLVPTLKVPKQNMHMIMKNKALAKVLLKFKGLPPVVEPADPKNTESKVILLNPNIIKSQSDIDLSIASELENAGVSLQSIASMVVTLNYDNWNHRDILGAVLPCESPGVSGFSQIGHIIHLNLKSELLDYKDIIGQVLLDKVKTAKTVVNKTGVIDNTFRNFQMEVLAGDEDFITVAHECGATYKMDFSKVYWNPRLAFEHERVVGIFQPGDIVFDMCAGIGPFSIPAAKKKCVVFANDLNPESYKWLNDNMKRNKVKDQMHCYNLDGRDFARTVIVEKLPKIIQTQSGGKTVHIVMNLPAIAVEFTDVFPGLLETCNFRPENSDTILPIHVYCYCFSKDKEPKTEIKQRLEQSMGSENVPDFEVRFVRNVAPGKEMFRIMFLLSWSLLTSSRSRTDNEGVPDESFGQSVEPPEKKIKSSV